MTQQSIVIVLLLSVLAVGRIPGAVVILARKGCGAPPVGRHYQHLIRGLVYQAITN